MSDKNQPASNQAHVFLDLDGVLADFDKHARTQGKMKPGGGVDYAALDYQWWITMPPCAGAKEFFDTVCKEASVNFLSGPVQDEECYAGKAHWVQTFAPEQGWQILRKLILCDSQSKGLLAAPNRILVDDRLSNIKDWEAAGGIGIHHTGNFEETLKNVRAAIAKINAPAAKKRPSAKPGPKP